jgi:hypothetical protein
MAEADSRCSPDERSDFIAGALHRSTRGQAEIRSGEVSWRRPRQGRPSCRRKFSEADLFYSLGLAHADPSTMIKFPTELFNLSEITF